jgi:hypothetical protein
MTLNRVGPGTINVFKLVMFAVIAAGIAIVAYYGSANGNLGGRPRDAGEESQTIP